MFKNVFVAAAILIASPALVSAQDIFWSFSRTELATTSSGELGQTGSAYIFSDLSLVLVRSTLISQQVLPV